jgi:hypothetical protein
MKTNTNLPEPTFEKRLSGKLKNTSDFMIGVLKLTKKLFML